MVCPSTSRIATKKPEVKIPSGGENHYVAKKLINHTQTHGTLHVNKTQDFVVFAHDAFFCSLFTLHGKARPVARPAQRLQ
jgi:hypothetical protein